MLCIRRRSRLLTWSPAGTFLQLFVCASGSRKRDFVRQMHQTRPSCCHVCFFLPAGVVVELLALPQTGLWTLPALTQAGVGVEGLIPGTLRSTHTATQLLVPPLAGRTPLPLSLTFTLTFTCKRTERRIKREGYKLK